MTEVVPAELDDLVPTGPTYSFPAHTMPVAEARALGRGRRSRLPRRSLAELLPVDRDPILTLEEQNVDRLPDLVPIRIGRMLESPFAYYRGSAAVMAQDLAREQRTGIDLVVCGDAHISNFGLFASPERRVLFDLNDFDEAAFGPWEWDIKRLVASAVIGARDIGLTRAQCTDAALSAASGYRVALNDLFDVTALERFYFRVDTEWLEAQAGARSQAMLRATVKKARRRTSDRVLAKITTTDVDGEPRIIDEFPVIRHEDAYDVGEIAGLYDAYRRTVRIDVALLLEQFRVVDVVRRIVGVGSVGTRCGIALLLGRSGEPLFIQIKEAPPSVLDTYGGLRRPPNGSDVRVSQGLRVVAGQSILQAASDPMLGWISFGGRDYYLRQFRDMKGSVELSSLTAGQFDDYCGLCGQVLARAHVQSPDAIQVAGYLGRSARFDDAVAAWAHDYADQVERDFSMLEAAVRTGRMAAESGV